MPSPSVLGRIRSVGALLLFAHAAAQSVTCGNVPCGSGDSACITVQVSRGGTSYSQTLWVNSSTGLTYLPLVQRTTQPFPTVAQLNAGTAVAPNSAVYTKQVTAAHVYLVAYSCVHIIISSNGSAAIDTLDATFAVTNDQTAGTYAAGLTAPSVAYAAPYACTGSTGVAALLAGTIATAGYGNVNLSGTAFAVASTTCGGAASCTCSGAGSPVCGSFTASTYTGSGAILYSLSGQAVVLLADGNCGSWVPSSWLVPLDGRVAPTNPSCGGVPCGTAGSTCVAVNVRRGGGAGGAVCCQRRRFLRPPPFARAGLSRGSSLQPNTLGRGDWADIPTSDTDDDAPLSDVRRRKLW